MNLSQYFICKIIYKGTYCQVGKDSDGALYIFQKIDECDKNHDERDTTDTNQGRIYEK